jgi:hypothetical protein
MNKKQKIVVAIFSVTVSFLAIVAVTAAPWSLKTPLYRYRMEQASSKMNFLPFTMNDFSYITETGYSMNYEIEKDYDRSPLKPWTEIETCPFTCDDDTCFGYTCPVTCEPTCMQYTCENSCHSEPSCKIECEP